jgi:glycerophosphoryl diester phosphodiesterase
MAAFFDYFPDRGYICAHRGERSTAPENTLLALEKARLSGADLWEFDVQCAALGAPVVFHDDSLERTTDITDHPELQARKSAPLTAFQLSELRTLNAGSWFIRDDPFGTIASGEVTEAEFSAIKAQKIPLLPEVLSLAARYRFPFNLEIKDLAGTPADGTVVAQVLTHLQQSGTENLALISSFRHQYLRQVKQINPAVATAALVEKKHPSQLLDYLRELQVEAYHPAQNIADTELIRYLVAAAIRVNLWTVNDADRARKLAEAGATFICTDWPQKMVGDLSR